MFALFNQARQELSIATILTWIGQVLGQLHAKHVWIVYKYTTVDGLRRTFGSNTNVVWGDFDGSTTRRLYQTLLPTCLLQLHQAGFHHPQDLAPLAYQARKAAKLYARERSHVHTRVAAQWYDGIRQWLKYGRFQTTGMTYRQLWQKYASQLCGGEREEDLQESVCRTILVKSCTTNGIVDSLFVANKNQAQEAHLQPICETLERDVRALLCQMAWYSRQTNKQQLLARVRLVEERRQF